MPVASSEGSAQPAREPLVLRERKGPVAVLTLNRPDARNSLSEAMLQQLAQALAVLKAHRDVRAVVIAGSGPAFCAGHDLKEIAAHRDGPDFGRAYFTKLMKQCAGVMQSIVRFPKPVIAAVEGTATAAGVQLVATCDLAVASETARFCTPGVNIGLFCSTPMVALSRNVSRKHAMEMLLLGEMMPAADAERFGLVNRVVPAGKALEEALALASRIAEKSPLTLQIGKEAFYAQAEMRLEEAYDYASEVMVENMLTHDAAEGIDAFLAKRPAEWKGA
jgi:enoyl-CoA hydratase/carnithine racemase